MWFLLLVTFLFFSYYLSFHLHTIILCLFWNEDLFSALHLNPDRHRYLWLWHILPVFRKLSHFRNNTQQFRNFLLPFSFNNISNHLRARYITLFRLCYDNQTLAHTSLLIQILGLSTEQKTADATEDMAVCLLVASCALNVKSNCRGELVLGLAVLRRTLPYQEMMKALGI